MATSLLLLAQRGGPTQRLTELALRGPRLKTVVEHVNKRPEALAWKVAVPRSLLCAAEKLQTRHVTQEAVNEGQTHEYLDGLAHVFTCFHR